MDKSILFILLNTLLLVVAIEFVSYGILRGRGVDSALFLSGAVRVEGPKDGEKFSTLDPHLGYAHGKNERLVKNLGADCTWVDGFVVYGKNPDGMKHPVILALGGSTTDGVNYGHSWPEELSKILREKKIAGTVVNGGTGGYSTSQELFKLIRDGLEFRPDIVISFSGINDRGKYGRLPHPMVHRYQRELLETLAQKTQSRILPATVTLLQDVTGIRGNPGIDCTFGVKSSLGLAGQYRKNVELMNIISMAHGAKFFAFIQPCAFYKSRHGDNPDIAKGEAYKEQVLALYGDIARLPGELPFVHDATAILEGHENVYKTDGIHLQPGGDRIVAEYVFGRIEAELLGKAKGN